MNGKAGDRVAFDTMHLSRLRDLLHGVVPCFAGLRLGLLGFLGGFIFGSFLGGLVIGGDELDDLAGAGGHAGMERDALAVCENEFVEGQVQLSRGSEIGVERGGGAPACGESLDFSDMSGRFGADADDQLVEGVDRLDHVSMHHLTHSLDAHFFVKSATRMAVPFGTVSGIEVRFSAEADTAAGRGSSRI